MEHAHRQTGPIQPGQRRHQLRQRSIRDLQGAVDDRPCQFRLVSEDAAVLTYIDAQALLDTSKLRQEWICGKDGSSACRVHLGLLS